MLIGHQARPPGIPCGKVLRCLGEHKTHRRGKLGDGLQQLHTKTGKVITGCSKAVAEHHQQGWWCVCRERVNDDGLQFAELTFFGIQAGHV
jgi:X-X-X-Leu-X-X-Gly heptad repeat protein